MSDDTSAGTEHAGDANGGGAVLEAVRMSAETNGASSGRAPERPRAQARSRRSAAREIGSFGGIPEECTAWGLKRQTRSGSWEPVSYGEGAVERHEWPLDELSDETILSRWGAGTYKTQWWKPGPTGGRKFIAQGTPVTYKDPAARVVDAPPAQAADPLGQHLEFMRLVGTEAETKIQSTLALARALMGERSGPAGISATDVLAIVREERAAQAAALQAQREEHAAQLAALEARLQATIEAQVEEEPSALEAAAAAAIGTKKKAGGFLGFLAAIAEHKDLIKDALPLAIGALSTINEGLKTTQVAAHAAAAQQRPQAQPRTTQVSGPVVDAELVESELEREQREAYERATAPIPPQ